MAYLLTFVYFYRSQKADLTRSRFPSPLGGPKVVSSSSLRLSDSNDLRTRG